jgi:hypothetical protein
MLARSPEELLYLMRDLLEKNLHDLDKELPVNIVWEIAKMKDLIISFYYYQNRKNIAKTAKDLGMSRTTLSYHISKNKHITEIVTTALENDKKRLMGWNKKINPPF